MLGEIIAMSVLIFSQLFVLAIIIMVSVDGWKKVVSDKNTARVAFWMAVFLLLVTGVGILQVFQFSAYLPAFLLFFIAQEIAQLIMQILFFVVDLFFTALIISQGTGALYRILKRYRSAAKSLVEEPQQPNT